MMERVSLLDMMTADEIRRLIKRQQAEIGALRSRFAEEKKQSYLAGKREAQAEIEHLELALEMNRTYWKKEVDNLQVEIDKLVNMLLYCNPVPAKKTQYEALMDKHRGE